MYFIARLDPGAAVYHLHTTLILDSLDIAALESA